MAVHGTLDEAKAETVKAAETKERRFVYELEHSSGTKAFIDAKSKSDAIKQYNECTILKCAVPGKAPAGKKEKKTAPAPAFDYSVLGE